MYHSETFDNPLWLNDPVKSNPRSTRPKGNDSLARDGGRAVSRVGTPRRGVPAPFRGGTKAWLLHSGLVGFGALLAGQPMALVEGRRTFRRDVPAGALGPRRDLAAHAIRSRDW